MANALASLALLKAIWDGPNGRRDFLEVFVPLVVALIDRKGYDSIDVAKVRQDFLGEFGLRIPHHPMLSILQRAQKGGFITSQPYGSRPIRERIQAQGFADVAFRQEQQYRQVITSFLRFAEETYNQILTEADADSAFLSFLQDHDLEILCVSPTADTALPTVSGSQSHSFLVGSFVRQQYELHTELFGFISDISVGHIIVSAVLCPELVEMHGSLAGCAFFLDTGLLFGLFGTDGQYRTEAVLELLKLLRDQGASLQLFRHTYEEFLGILDGCIPWLNNPAYDPLRASRPLVYFVQRGATASDVEQLKLSAADRIAEHSVAIVDPPVMDSMLDYRIDEQSLYDTIVGVYRNRSLDFSESDKQATILRDIRSISAIHTLRHGHRPVSLQDAKYVFVTTNSALALASRIYERNLSKDTYSSTPVTLTDVVAGTIAWAQASGNGSELNQKRLIANCYAALQPGRELVARLVETAERLKAAGTVTEEQVILLKQSQVAKNLLEEETLGDATRFTDLTPLEILKHIAQDARMEERNKLGSERAVLADREAKLQAQVAEERCQNALREAEKAEALDRANRAEAHQRQLERSIDSVADNVAGFVTSLWLVGSVACVLLAVGAQAMPSLSPSVIVHPLIIILLAALGAANLIAGVTIAGTRQWVRSHVKDLWIRLILGHRP